MKKIIIGAVFLLSGVIISMSIVLAAAFNLQSITQWSGSKLWYAIFGAKQYGSQVVQSLFLGVPFVIGILFGAIGVMMLLIEYFKKQG